MHIKPEKGVIEHRLIIRCLNLSDAHKIVNVLVAMFLIIANIPWISLEDSTIRPIDE